MATQDFLDSVSCLSDMDKNRMICVLLHSTFSNSQIDWETATNAFGSKSKASMQRMYHAARQKYREHNGLGGNGHEKTESTTKVSKARNGAKRPVEETYSDDEEPKLAKPTKKSKTPSKNNKVKSEVAVKEEQEERSLEDPEDRNVV